jgi:hypothetical protein
MYFLEKSYFRERWKKIDINCLFYLVHDCYVRRLKRLFVKYAATLVAYDLQGVFTKCLSDFLREKN